MRQTPHGHEVKPRVLYVLYSHTEEDWDEQRNEYRRKITKIHGIFTQQEIPKYAELRKQIGASCMIVPSNKFVESGVEL